MQDLAHILAEVVPHGHYVGGIVRSSLLKKQSGDIDITLPASEVKPAALALAKRLKAATFEMDPDLGVWRLVTHRQKIQIDLTAYQGKDLTADLKNKRICLNGPTRFVEDPLRMLRAFRCAAELKFTITPATLTQIKKNKNLIKQPAGERIKEELDRLFAVPGKTYDYLTQMDRCGLLTALFPLLEDQRGCAEVYYGPGGVLHHTLLVCKRMDYVLEHLGKAFPKYAKKLTPFCQNKPLYKMAALLHDIAKPKTAKMKDGRLRFFYHEQVGAKMARHVLEHLHYSRADIRLMCAMIGEHLRPSNLASNDILTQRGVYHFFRDLGEAAIPMLLLCWADYTSYVTDTQLRRILPKSAERMMTLTQAERFKNVGKTLRHLQLLHFMLGQFFDRPTTVKPIRVITGQDVMRVLGLKPGPQVGAILEAVAVAQVEGKIKTRKEALAFLKNLPSEILAPK